MSFSRSPSQLGMAAASMRSFWTPGRRPMPAAQGDDEAGSLLSGGSNGAMGARSDVRSNNSTVLVPEPPLLLAMRGLVTASSHRPLPSNEPGRIRRAMRTSINWCEKKGVGEV